MSKFNAQICAILFALAGIVAVVGGSLYYHNGKATFKARKTEEKATVLELVTSFVSTYSAHRVKDGKHEMPVPATYRALAFAAFNEGRKGGDVAQVEMVGVPDYEIATAPADQHAASTVSGMAKSGSTTLWSGFVGRGKAETLRTIRPVVADKQSCVTCHNRLQEGVKTWKVGDIMGAYVLDVPAAKFLSGLKREAFALGGITFLVISAIGLFLANAQRRIGEARQRAQEDRQEMLEEARKLAEQEAMNLSAEVQKINEQLRRTNKRLHENVGELKEAQDQLVKRGKLAQLGQLTATVAHEIRNPLSAVRTSAFLIERKFKEECPGIEKPLLRIGSGITRCDNIITELLDFARSRSLQLQEVDLDQWIRTLVSEQAEHLSAEIAIECHLGLDGAQVPIDPDVLSRAIINFLSNAAEAMVGKNKERPSTPTIDPKIIVATAITPRGVEISVTDNGPGITEDVMSKIMEPLFTTKSFGIGLGLPAVEKIFEQHGGGMDISSELGQGAKFTGWFPFHEEPQRLSA